MFPVERFVNVTDKGMNPNLGAALKYTLRPAFEVLVVVVSPEVVVVEIIEVVTTGIVVVIEGEPVEKYHE